MVSELTINRLSGLALVIAGLAAITYNVRLAPTIAGVATGIVGLLMLMFS